MENVKKLKISTKLLTGFLLLIGFSIINGVMGSREIQEINCQNKISQLANRCLVDFQDTQLAVERFINSQDESYMETVEEETAHVMSQAQAAEDLMLNEENKINTKALIHSMTVYRELSRQLFENQKDEPLSQNRILAQLENESRTIMANARNIRDNVDVIVGSITNHHRHITLLLSLLSAVFGGGIALLLTKSIKQQLGAEPYEIEEVASKISQGNFNVDFPSREFSGIFLSIKQMMEKLAETTASKAELEAEIRRRKLEEQKYQNLFDRMTEGFATHEIIVDETGHPVDYMFSSLNPAFEKLLGVKASDIIGKTVLEVFPDTESYWIEKYGEVALTGEPIQFENYSSAVNRYYSISAYSPEKGVFAVSFSDITERVLAEVALENQNELLSVTLKSIGDGVITTDHRGNITFINPVTEELTGWTNEEATGKPLEKVFHIVHEETRERCINPAQKVLETGEVVELANHTCLISQKGEWSVIEDSAAPIRDHGQNILGVVIVFRDTTEKKKLRESALNMERLESLGVLAGGIAHDFNNYLAGIFGYVELVKNRLETGTVEKNRGYLTKILKISERAKSLTQQLLTFSKGGNPIRNSSVLMKLSGQAYALP